MQGRDEGGEQQLPIQRRQPAPGDLLCFRRNDAEPVIGAHVGCVLQSPPTCPLIDGGATDGATSGVDSIPQSGSGSTPTLQATFSLQGLQNSGQTDPAILLRSSVQARKQTGAMVCGLGQNGASGLSN